MTTALYPTAAVVRGAIAKAERTNKWTAEKSGFAMSTFNRKIAGHVDFTVSELARIALALGTNPCELLPVDFRSEVDLAA